MPIRLNLKRGLAAFLFFHLLTACSGNPATPATQQAQTASTDPTAVPTMNEKNSADVVSVSVQGNPSAYTFLVEISSPDEGCDKYADWWEVITEDGQLLYRRILLHSHVNEQPFTRSGGPVPIDADTIVLVRAHMNPGGYGGLISRGSVAGGFQEERLEPGAFANLEQVDPLPENCDF